MVTKLVMIDQKKIKIALLANGISQADIARMLKVSPPSVHNVITGKRRTPRIRMAIALAIGKPVAEVFPDHQERL